MASREACPTTYYFFIEFFWELCRTSIFVDKLVHALSSRACQRSRGQKERFRTVPGSVPTWGSLFLSFPKFIAPDMEFVEPIRLGEGEAQSPRGSPDWGFRGRWIPWLASTVRFLSHSLSKCRIRELYPLRFCIKTAFLLINWLALAAPQSQTT